MNPPNEYLCPILMIPMEDPVIGSDGRTYERSAIEEALKRDPRSPLTREPMKASSLRANYALKSLIERYKGVTVVNIQPQKQQQQQQQQHQQQQQLRYSAQQPLLTVVSRPAPTHKNYIILLFAMVGIGSLVAVIAVLLK